MRPVVTDEQRGLSVMILSPAKMAKAIELPFEVCTRVGPLDGSPDPHMHRNNSEGGRKWTAVDALLLSKGQHWCSADVD